MRAHACTRMHADSASAWDARAHVRTRLHAGEPLPRLSDSMVAWLILARVRACACVHTRARGAHGCAWVPTRPLTSPGLCVHACGRTPRGGNGRRAGRGARGVVEGRGWDDGCRRKEGRNERRIWREESPRGSQVAHTAEKISNNSKAGQPQLVRNRTVLSLGHSVGKF